MSKPDVLAVAKPHPFFQKALEATYTVHDRTHVTDPAAFAQLAPRIVAVAATDRNDGLASFSNVGAKSVDLGAPGVSIVSTVPAGTFNPRSASCALMACRPAR